MYSIELIKSVRNKFISLIDGLSLESVNKVPTGFNNNIVWNFGHAVVSAYLISYVSTGVNKSIEIPLVEKFRKGTKPETFVTKDEIEILKKLSANFLINLEKDIADQKFTAIKSYTTQTFGIEFKTLDEMLITVLNHDVLHFSTASNFKRLV